MDVLGSAETVLQNQVLTQNRLTSDVNALASGLRVRSASDDPSGYAIAQTLQTKVAGLQQSVTNVQTADNLLAVADGALSSIEDILQRIRSLVVQSNSDINSQSDLEDIQTEIDQMLLEINKISSETNFNGLTLFNGQFQQNTDSSNVAANVTYLSAPFPNPATGETGSDQLVNGTGTGGGPGSPAQFITVLPLVGSHFQPTFTVWSIISASNNMFDPDTGTYQGPGVLIQEEAYSTAGSGFGPSPLFIDTFALGYSSFPDGYGSGPYTIVAPSNYPANANPNFQSGYIYNGITLNNFSAADVGVQEAILTTIAQAPVTTGHALDVNDGGDEGTTVGINLPQINTQLLNISGINVTDPEVTQVVQNDQNNQTEVTGVSSSNAIAAGSAEVLVDQALQTIGNVRSQVGAQTISLQQDANNDNTAIVNLGAAESNIRDANIGATVTDYTQQQILVSVGNSVLAQLNVNAQQLTALLLNSFSGLGLPPGGGQSG